MGGGGGKKVIKKNPKKKYLVTDPRRGVRLLHILILHQFFAVNGSMPGRRFFEIGRRLIQQGHQVTVITGNSELGLPLGRKKIGLLQKDGMAIVVFNLGCPQVKEGERKGINATFARRAARQGRRLPRPDLVLASSPPLATAGPAYSLSCFYEVPLIMEIRKIEAVPLDYRDSLWKRIFTPRSRERHLRHLAGLNRLLPPAPVLP